MDVLDELARHFERRPMVLLRCGGNFARTLLESKDGLERFTFAGLHSVFGGIETPTMCLAEISQPGSTQCYAGIIKAKTAVSTFDTRLTAIRFREVSLPSFDLLNDEPEDRFRGALPERLPESYSIKVLTPQLGVQILAMLRESDLSTLQAIAFFLSQGMLSDPEWAEMDAVQVAMAAFGLSKSTAPVAVSIRGGAYSTLENMEAHALEDNVIGQDASIIPGFSLIEKHVTGRAVFVNSNEKLEVYTANRGLLEEMLGVDLIYVNNILGNTIMIQYKMLEPEIGCRGKFRDWVFRPDEQVESEIFRMKVLQIEETIDDYRLHADPFYFKFVQRKGDGDSHRSFYISLEHLKQLLQSPRVLGPRGGVRITYDALEGTYLRESNIVSLLRSGYIGMHRVQTKLLAPIIEQVSAGNRGLVLAWQEQRQREEEHL
jgi:hypothetical protein